MPKKTFATAPKPRQPTADEIDAYERGGTGHDRADAPVPAPEARPAERSKRLSLDLPESVHTRFKTACSATGRKMVSEIQGFIERRTAELESEGGISRK
jgi:ParG protein